MHCEGIVQGLQHEMKLVYALEALAHDYTEHDLLLFSPGCLLSFVNVM